MNNENKFEYTYSAKKQEEIEAIKKKYMPPQEDKMEQLRKLDKSVERPGTIISLVLGIIGTLLMGTGMSLVMVWQERYLIPGIVIGVIGIVILVMAYPVYKKITQIQRNKIAPQILALSAEIEKQQL